MELPVKQEELAGYRFDSFEEMKVFTDNFSGDRNVLKKAIAKIKSKGSDDQE